MSRIAFIIPVRNDPERLARCLSAIARDARSDVVVADNGSTDDTPEVARRAGATVLHLPGLRVSELRNQAASASNGDVLGFVDADHEISPGWSDAAAEILMDPAVAAAGAMYTSPDRTWVQTMYGVLRGETRGRRDVAWLGSGNLAIRRTAFESVGGFDAELEACEDVDLCQRLRRQGWRIVGDERLRSVHFGDPSTLGALFRAERWRGRDNVAVSLRGPLSWRDLPGLATPIFNLMGVALILMSPLGPLIGVRPLLLAGIGAIVVVGLALLKAIHIAVRARRVRPIFLLQAFVVTFVYHMARAFALITRAGHHRNR